MKSRYNNQLITTLVTRMILQIAPHEMQLFQGQKEEYLRNPQQIINKRGFSNQSTGHEKILFLAPIVRNILHDVIDLLELGQKNEPLNQSATQLNRLTSKKSKEIYNFAYEQACQYELSPLKAHLVADAVLNNFSSPTKSI